MVRSVPRPLTSMPPPSSTTGRPSCDGAAQPQPRRLRRALGDLVVLPVVGVLRPGVEAEPGDRHLGLRVLARARRWARSRASSRGRSASGRTRRGPVGAPTRSRMRRAFASCAFDGDEDADDLALARACARSRRRPRGWARSLPGQSRRLCGQPSQVASCGSHSAGMRKSWTSGSRAGLATRATRGRGSAGRSRRRRRSAGRAGRASGCAPPRCGAGSTSPTRISSRSVEASAITTPERVGDEATCPRTRGRPRPRPASRGRRG